MKIETAIEILTLDKTCDFEGDADDLEKAIQLGIEALKRHREQRIYSYCVIMEPLPGETNE